MGEPLIVGLIGGIGSGKSRIAQYFRELGATVIQGDRIGHEVLLEGAVRTRILERWGGDLVTQDGQIDRSKLAKIVFAQEASGRKELAFLESLLHPEIGRRIEQAIHAARDAGAKVVVLDAPVLLKAGWDRHCDRIIFVDVPERVRWERVRQRSWSREMFRQRESAQTPLSIKRQRSDCVIDNSGPWDETQKQLDARWQEWMHGLK